MEGEREKEKERGKEEGTEEGRMDRRVREGTDGDAVHSTSQAVCFFAPGFRRKHHSFMHAVIS